MIELVCTMVIIGVLGSIVSAVIMRAGTTFTGAAVGAQTSADASATMDVIYRQLRAINAKAASSPAAPNITGVTATSISFNSGAAIALSGTTLQFTESGGSAQTLATNVSTFLVEPMNASDAVLAVPLAGAACDAVQRFRVTLAITRGGSTETLRTKVFIRSLFAGAAP